MIDMRRDEKDVLGLDLNLPLVFEAVEARAEGDWLGMAGNCHALRQANGSQAAKEAGGREEWVEDWRPC